MAFDLLVDYLWGGGGNGSDVETADWSIWRSGYCYTLSLLYITIVVHYNCYTLLLLCIIVVVLYLLLYITDLQFIVYYYHCAL